MLDMACMKAAAACRGSLAGVSQFPIKVGSNSRQHDIIADLHYPFYVNNAIEQVTTSIRQCI